MSKTSKEKQTMRVWYVRPFGSIKEEVAFMQPDTGGAVSVLTGSIESSRQIIRESVDETDIEIDLVETFGTKGIAITDPMWNGQPTFRCGNKKCNAVHDVHENVAQNLYQRSTESTRQRVN